MQSQEIPGVSLRLQRHAIFKTELLQQWDCAVQSGILLYERL